MGNFWVELLKWLTPEAIAWAKAALKGERKILILGAGGVGKSSLGELLAESMSMLNVNTDYSESPNTEIFSVEGKGIVAKVHVVAGQAHRRDATWPELLGAVQGGSIDGIILMNAYGYHAIGPLGLQGQKEYVTLQKAGQEENFLEEHLRLNREEEIEVLEYIAPYLKARKKPLWLLSVIAKEDLWFDNRDDVRHHYEAGRYAEAVQAVRAAIGANSFHHEAVMMSLAIKDFSTGRNELLAKTSVNYDQSHQRESAKKFFKTLALFCKNKK